MLLSRITEAKLAADEDYKETMGCKSESKQEARVTGEDKAESKVSWQGV
jgi:hypothetical protein